MTANDILFRCSSLGYLMTNPRTGTDISETTKTHLVDVYVSHKYNRFTEINGKYLDKGNDVEEASITVVSRRTKKFFKKNEQHLKNLFIMGTPDLFEGESIEKAEEIRDTKSSWDVYTFNRAKNKPLDPKYKWQGIGYMALTGAKVCYIDYCLNNTPYYLIEKELRFESYNQPDGNTPNWIELQIIANHVYDRETFQKYIDFRGIAITDEYCQTVYDGFVEIPLEERHFSFEIKRDLVEIDALYKQIRRCRTWMNENLFNVEENG